MCWESLHTDPGSLVCLPRTNTSGANPSRMLKAFLAWVQCANAICKSCASLMGCSRSYLSNMLDRIWPCLSAFPFCQWASVLMVVHFTLHCCINWENCSALSSVAASTNISFGLPAPRKPWLDDGLNGMFHRSIWCIPSHLETRAVVYNMIEMEIGALLLLPGYPIYRDNVVEITWGMDCCGSANFRSTHGLTCWTLQITCGGNHLWPETLLFQ